jgi:dolichyl-diphosphooligosaccharide---protein glycosyltransferase
MTTTSSSAAPSKVFGFLWTALASYGVYLVCKIAYRIRLRAIEDYGPVIHEFDPYFNYRATEVRCKKQLCHQLSDWVHRLQF